MAQMLWCAVSATVTSLPLSHPGHTVAILQHVPKIPLFPNSCQARLRPDCRLPAFLLRRSSHRPHLGMSGSRAGREGLLP